MHLNELIFEDLIQLARQSWEVLIDKFVSTLQRDSEFYAFVDGEEGDFGLTRFHDGLRTYFVWVNFGGDRYDFYATEYGKQELRKALTRDGAHLSLLVRMTNDMQPVARLPNINDDEISQLAAALIAKHPEAIKP